MYLNEARDDGIPYVTLPDQINLSNPNMADEYAQESYTTNKGQTFHGAPIQASIAPLKNGNLRAATQTIQLLTGPTSATTDPKVAIDWFNSHSA